MELCLEQTFSSANRPCVGFDSIAGAATNLIALIALAALLTFVVKVLHTAWREAAVTDDDFKRILLKGVTPWLFVGGYILWLGAYLLARLTQ